MATPAHSLSPATAYIDPATLDSSSDSATIDSSSDSVTLDSSSDPATLDSNSDPATRHSACDSVLFQCQAEQMQTPASMSRLSPAALNR